MPVVLSPAMVERDSTVNVCPCHVANIPMMPHNEHCISGVAIGKYKSARISCAAFQSAPQPRIPFKAKMHVNAIQQLFRPSFCAPSFCCHWTLSVTVGSLDFSFGGFCCFSCVAHLTSFLRILKFGVATRGLGTGATSNSTHVPRQLTDIAENAKYAPAAHLSSSDELRRSPHVHNQCLKCESCELPPCELLKNYASRLTGWK